MIPDGVVLDARTVSPRFPGIGRYVLGLLRGSGDCAATDPCRVTRPPCVLTSLTPDPRLPSSRTLKVTSSPFDLRQQWEVPRALRDCGARLYHSPYYLMPLHPGVVTVLNCWDVIPLAVRGLFGRTGRLAYRAAHLLAFRVAQAIVVPTETTRADVLRFFPRSGPKLVVVAPGSQLNVELSGQEAEARRRSLGLPSEYVLYAGSNKPHKNLPLLAAAWAGAVRTAPGITRHVQLVVAGPVDSRYPDAAAAAAANEVAGRVIGLGHVDDETLAALYQGARLFVFPSAYEGFGLPVVEAMARGVPVVCGDARALMEVAGDAAVTCPGGNPDVLAAAIVRLLDDEGERQRLRAAGLSRAARFTWEATARATFAVYHRALGAMRV